MEDFTTQVGQPSASLASFTIHGFSDNFLAARVRFLAAYERVYSTEHPLSEKQRTIRLPKPLFAVFESLQHQHHQRQDWITKNPDAEGGEESRHNSFAVAHWQDFMTTKPHRDNEGDSKQPDVDKNQRKKLWSAKRKYNWWIPLASSSPEIRYAHDMMVSHGITLLSAIWEYGPGPIELNEATRHIERTNDLCINHIEKYWQLAQQANLERKFQPDSEKPNERQLQLGYVQNNVAICEQIARDLAKARLLAPDRVMRGSRRVSTGTTGG
jgi:hypothetical protein